ncbi:MAG: DUF1571 domain-containing protein [Janthinobacterium lividum]
MIFTRFLSLQKLLALAATGVFLSRVTFGQQPALSVPITTPQLISRLIAAVEDIKSMQVTIDARERVENKYIGAVSAIKLTTTPIRVYLKNQKGVEVLYVAGENDGDAWVYPAAFPYITLSLNPQGSLMRRDQHHTVFQTGFGTITDLLKDSEKLPDKSFYNSFRYTGDSIFQRRTCYVLRSDYPQFRYIAYKATAKETPASIAARFNCGEYRILERNKLSIGDHLADNQVLQVPNTYAKRTVIVIDPKTFLPASISVYDERGLYERYEFSNVLINQPIPAEEFTKKYKGYKL